MGRAHTHTRAACRRWLLVGLAALAPLLLAMRCANEDLSPEFRLELPYDGVPELVGTELTYTGRLALDLGMEAEAAGDIRLRVQAQTSGDPDVDGCDVIQLGRIRDAETSVWDGTTVPTQPSGTYPILGNVSVRTTLALHPRAGAGDFSGVLEIQAARTLVRVYSSSDTLAIWDIAGNIVPPVEPTRPASCDDVFVTVYELPAERTRLGYISSEATVEQAIVEDCTAQRVVQATCPGSSSPQQEHVFALEAGERRTERLSQLGVGDTLVLEATCQGACPATVTAFAWIEPLSCHSRNDCSGARSCTPDGYCVKEPPPSCAIGTHAALWLATAFGGLLLRRRRGRR